MELVAEASTGVEAIDQFRKYRPNVTLLDLQMPELGGIDAIKTIRDEFPEARIILTTYCSSINTLEPRISKRQVPSHHLWRCDGNCWTRSGLFTMDRNEFHPKWPPGWPNMPLRTR
jgi:hypothetical protein